MVHVSLDRQIFFTPSSAASGKPACRSRSPRNGGPSAPSLGGGKKLERGAHGNRLGSTGPSQPDVVLISSDSESDYGDLDDGQSDTSFPPVDELLPTKRNVGSGTAKPFNPASGGDRNAEEPSTAGIANSDGQRSEPLTRAAVRHGSKESPLAQVVGPMRPTASSWLLQMPGARYTAASSPSLFSPRPPSPGPLQTDPSPTNGTENPPEASLALQNSDTASDTRVPDIPGPSLGEDVADLHGPGSQRDSGPLTSSHVENSQPQENSAYLDPADQADEWDKKHPFSLKAIRRRLHHCRADELGQQRTRNPERSPTPPATVPPRLVSASPRVVQQDEPVPQGRASCEARQASPPRDTTYSKAAAEISHVTLLGAEASHSPNHPAVSPGNGTHQESTPRRVSASKGDRNDEAMPPRVKPKAGRRRAAARGNRVNDNDDEAEGVQQFDKDGDILPPPRKRRRASSRRNLGPHRQDSDDEEVYSPFQDSDNQRDTQPPQRKRHRSSSLKPARTTASGRQTGSNYKSTGSRKVQIPTPPSSQDSGDQQESVKALSAKFTQWLLESAVVRSAIVDGVTTFQLQFKADLYCSKHRHRVLSSPQSDCGSNSPAKWRNSKLGPITSLALTSGKNPPVSQLDDDVQPRVSTEEAEWEVEKILETRKRGRGHQVGVKWVGFEKPTWEPLKNFLGTEALRAYMAQHGNIASIGA